MAEEPSDTTPCPGDHAAKNRRSKNPSRNSLSFRKVLQVLLPILVILALMLVFWPSCLRTVHTLLIISFSTTCFLLAFLCEPDISSLTAAAEITLFGVKISKPTAQIVLISLSFAGFAITPSFDVPKMQREALPEPPSPQETTELDLRITPMSEHICSHGFVRPPKLEIVGTSNTPLQQDSMRIQMGKLCQYEEPNLPYVDPNFLHSRLTNSARHIIVTFDPAEFIESLYPTTPHGLYRVRGTLTSLNMNDKTECTTFKCTTFNYVYQPDFSNIEKILAPPHDGFTPIEGGGLKICNVSTLLTSTDINQAVALGAGLWLTGFFRMEFDDGSKPSGLDIVLVDEWNRDRLSIVIPDGHLNSFSIKTADDNLNTQDFRRKSMTATVIPSTEDEIVDNYFLIVLSQEREGYLCSVYVSPRSRKSLPESLAHSRLLEKSTFEGSEIRVRLRLWKAGTVRLYDFTLGELVSAAR